MKQEKKLPPHLLSPEDKRFLKWLTKNPPLTIEGYKEFAEMTKEHMSEYSITVIILIKSVTTIMEKLMKEDSKTLLLEATDLYNTTPIIWNKQLIFNTENPRFKELLTEVSLLMMTDFTSSSFADLENDFDFDKTSLTKLLLNKEDSELLLQVLLNNVKIEDEEVLTNLLSLFTFITDEYKRITGEGISYRTLYSLAKRFIISKL